MTALPPSAAPAPSTSLDASAGSGLAELLGESAPRAWYRQTRLWIVAMLVVFAALAWWLWHVRSLAQDQPLFVTQAAERGNLTLTVSANGTIQPTRSINIGSELSGTVLEVHADVNDRVKKGQVLVVLDTAKLRDQILRSEATLAASTARVAQTMATLHEAQATMARLDAVAVVSRGLVPSQAELGGGRATVERALADAASARAGVKDSQAALALDHINLSKASITAPADGMVLTRTVEPGNAVAASLQAVTLFTVAEDLSHLRLWVYVDEADVGSVKNGQEATFTVSAYPTRKFPARITRVGFGSTTTDNVVTYLTYLDVSNDDMSLRPGMTASASITAIQHNDVLLVPNTSLRFSPTSAAAVAAVAAAKTGALANLGPRIPGGNRRPASVGASTANAKAVWVEREGIAVQVAVVTGISDGRMTEITSGDLRAGMQVITDQKSSKKP
ncbi:MAG: efflux transporter periplasmic adaptor subunit [Burkholderiales bacterium PBB4]|nr:MAG: efflux transporter periplasmic adaptor subunit [Burkholderiales bacterium PBB4]